MNFSKKSIISPMAVGNGAHVFHKMIESRLPSYKVLDYSPRLTFFPFSLPGVIRGIPCSAIHTTADYGLFFARKNIPLVLTIYHYMCDTAMRPYSSSLQVIHYRTDLKWFIRKSVTLASLLLTSSHYTAEHVKKELKLDREIKVIYGGVDEEAYFPQRSRQAPSSIRVLFSGNLTKRKGAHWLPEIAQRLDQGIVIHHTSGLRYTGLHPSGLNITNLGRVAFQDMPGLYQEHDILLSPTIREGFGLAIAEAMACGLPVVATDCSCIPELIDQGKGGFLCPVGDVAAFAEKINILADSPSMRKAMGEYNRAKIEKYFTLDRMVKQYTKLFEEVLDGYRLK